MFDADARERKRLTDWVLPLAIERLNRWRPGWAGWRVGSLAADHMGADLVEGERSAGMRVYPLETWREGYIDNGTVRRRLLAGGRPRDVRTEWDKLMDGWVDAYFWAWADEGKRHLLRWCVADMRDPVWLRPLDLRENTRPTKAGDAELLVVYMEKIRAADRLVSVWDRGLAADLPQGDDRRRMGWTPSRGESVWHHGKLF